MVDLAKFPGLTRNEVILKMLEERARRQSNVVLQIFFQEVRIFSGRLGDNVYLENLRLEFVEHQNVIIQENMQSGEITIIIELT